MTCACALESDQLWCSSWQGGPVVDALVVAVGHTVQQLLEQPPGPVFLHTLSKSFYC